MECAEGKRQAKADGKRTMLRRGTAGGTQQDVNAENTTDKEKKKKRSSPRFNEVES